MEQNITVACFVCLVVVSSYIEGRTISDKEFHPENHVPSLKTSPQIIKRSFSGNVPSESIERLLVDKKSEIEEESPRLGRSPLNRMPSYFGKRARMDRMPAMFGKRTRMDRMPAMFGKRSRMDRMPAMFGKRSTNQQTWFNDQDEQDLLRPMSIYSAKRSTMERMPAMFGKRSKVDRMPSLFGKRSTVQRMPSLFGKRSTLNRMPSLFGKRKVYFGDVENSDDISEDNVPTYEITDFELPDVSASVQTADDEIENDLNSNIFVEDS